jgi:hypothetical protein
MSSPIHHAKDLDAALMYAPPWARDRERAMPMKPIATAVERPQWGWLPEKRGDVFSGDRAMVELQRQLTLHPDRLPEPPPESASALWPFAVRLCAVTGIAALVAWGLVSLTGARKSGIETVEASVALPVPVSRVKVVHVDSALGTAPPAREASAAPNTAPPKSEIARVPSQQTEIPAGPPAQIETPAVPASQSTSQPTGPTLVLASDEIATLVRRGKDFLVNGDLASARLLLRRAAEAGSAEAALALGTTFDPLILARLGAIGAAPDIARARQWYQRAAELGSNDASQQLAKLAQTQQ